MPVKDLSGMKFGRLTVVEFSGLDRHGKALWKVKCDCGTEKIVLSRALTFGNSMSCGCMQREMASDLKRQDITGKRFGRLVAIEITQRVCGTSRIWKCQCDCGNITEASVSCLNSKHTTSCGCYRKEQLLKSVVTHGMSRTPEYARSRAHARREKSYELDYSWNFRLDREIRVFFKTCVICGSSDRITTDHVYPLSKGYGLAIGNAIGLCAACNSSKNDKMPDELPEDIRRKIIEASVNFQKHCEKVGIS